MIGVNISKDKRTGWLLNLKVGDEVFTSNCGMIRSLKRVDKITPTGRIVVGNETFDENGRLIGNKDSWNRRGIMEATEERLEKYNIDIIKNAAFRLMGCTPIQYKDLSEEHATQIIQILSSYHK